MYAVNVRDHFMIAHSFKGQVFGPAQRMHGATYVVDMEMRRQQLDEDGIVVDIGLATKVLQEELARLNFQNLDEMPEFKGQNTTTEFLAHVLFDRVAARLAAGDLGAQALPTAKDGGICHMKVTLNESHVAWASYEGSLPVQRA